MISNSTFYNSNVQEKSDNAFNPTKNYMRSVGKFLLADMIMCFERAIPISTRFGPFCHLLFQSKCCSDGK